MIEAPARVPEGGVNVLTLQIREIPEDVLGTLSGSQKVEEVDHADAHATNARPSPALLGVHGDAGQRVAHRTVSSGRWLMIAAPHRRRNWCHRTEYTAACPERREGTPSAT